MKMKSLLKSSMFVAALLAGTSAYADTFTVDGIIYEALTETTCKVAKNGTSYSGALNIPSRVTNEDVTYTVTEVGDDAFNGATFVNGLTLPSTIEKIGSTAFRYTNMAEVTIPENCTSIGNNAFDNCNKLTSVTILGPVKTVGDQAFFSNKVTKLVFPEGLETVGFGAFGAMTSMTEIEFPSTFKSIDMYAFMSDAALTKVTCKAVTPPTTQGPIFTTAIKATLYVPKGSKDAYAAAMYWKNFPTIEEIETTGVEAVDAEGVKVVANGGVINVAGAEGDVEVYNAAGQLLYKGAGEAISVPAKGITIVKVGGKAVKVAL
ncbi:MAG: leucine-rich repeat domain-containing protein [Muribaculaceae bacterium]